MSEPYYRTNSSYKPLDSLKNISYTESMGQEIKGFCDELTKTDLNREAFYEKMLEYISGDQRILYSQITSEIYGYYNSNKKKTRMI